MQKLNQMLKTNAEIFKFLIFQNLTRYRDIKNLLFQHILGILGRAWSHPPKIRQLICSSRGTLLTCQNIKTTA